jgi:DNA-binding transcriptional ArsR family regulator
MSLNRKGDEVGVPTVSEWLRALEVASCHPDDGGVTVTELSSAAGVSERVIQRGLKKLFIAGRLIVGRRLVATVIGDQRPVPTYQLKGKQDGS